MASNTSNLNSLSDFDRTRHALQFIPTGDHNERVRVGLALKHGHGEEGRTLWDEWRGDRGNDEAQAVWRSLRPDGTLTLGTLYYMAREAGWRDNQPYQPPSADTIAKRKQAADEQAKKEQEATQRERAETARKAADLLNAATEAKPDHPYLSRKLIPPVPNLKELDEFEAFFILNYAPKSGNEELKGRLLLVPVQQDGHLSTLEMIDEKGRKAALSGRGTKTGGYWTPSDLPTGDGAGLIIAIGEGVATVLSVTMTSERIGIATLCSGNLLPVTKKIRKRYPAATIIVLADLVKSTGEPDPHAVAAAKAVNGRLATPDFGNARATNHKDFNDLLVLKGAEAVEQCIRRSVETPANDPSTTTNANDATDRLPGVKYNAEQAPKSAQKKPAPRRVKTPASDDVVTDPRDPFRGTDIANADLMHGLHGENIRYIDVWGKWIAWTGTHWQIDESLCVETWSKDVAKLVCNNNKDLQSVISDKERIINEMESGEHKESDVDALQKSLNSLRKRSQHLRNLTRRLESYSWRKTMLATLKSSVASLHSDLDTHPFLLNTQSATIDLKTGATRPHDRADLLTTITPVDYTPGAQCPTWLKFLNDIFSNDQELIEFIQRAIGYSLTGSVQEQCFFICHGTGSNGKSVFLNVLRHLLGDKLAIQSAPDLLLSKGRDQHPTDVADLAGKRIVISQETDDGRRFNEVLVKQLTGGDAIRARRMREDFWQFQPTHKLWLATNHRPEIRGTDHGIWRRVRLIPFNQTFSDDGPIKKDPAMEDKLTAELPGILAWAIQGCLAWQRQGLGKASAVTMATNAYRCENDVLQQWLNDCCVIGRRYEAKASQLYQSYVQWCEETGEHPEKARKFGMRMAERGMQKTRGTAGAKIWIGIGLSTTQVTEVTEVTEKSHYQKTRGEEKNDVSDEVIVSDTHTAKIRDTEKSVTSVTSVTTDGSVRTHASDHMQSNNVGNNSKNNTIDWTVESAEDERLRNAGIDMDGFERVEGYAIADF